MLNRAVNRKLLNILGAGTLFYSQGRAVHANGKDSVVLTRDIASLFVKQPTGSLSTELTNGNKTHLEILLALRHQNISKDAFDFLAKLRGKIECFKDYPISVDSEIREFPLAMEKKYGPVQKSPDLTEAQQQKVAELADRYNNSGISFVVNFIHSNCNNELGQFHQEDEKTQAHSPPRSSL